MDSLTISAEVTLAKGLAAINSYVGPNPDDATKLIAAKCRGLLRGYHVQWKDAGYVPVAVERTLTAPLVNPKTNAKSRSFDLGGKLDVLAEHGGRRVLIDHKTTTAEIHEHDGPYWKQLVVEGQPSHYGILGWANDFKFDATVWDVIRKPSIRPVLVPTLDAEGLKIVHDAQGNRVRLASVKPKKTCPDCKGAGDTQQPPCPCTLGKWRQSASADEGQTLLARRETPEEYEERLVADIAERPDRYFQRRPVPRVDFELVEYAEQLWDVSQDMLTTRSENRHHKNSGACMNYGTPCKFLGVCSGHDTIESNNWTLKQTVHPELGEFVPSGRELLTNSRVRCFQTCKRKHFYEYELGVERVEEEEREALYFGNLLHVGLEAWFRCFMPAETESNQ